MTTLGIQPTFCPPFLLQFTEQEIAAILRDVDAILRSGRLTMGPYTERLEIEFARLVGTRHAVAVNSGTSALEVILRAIGVRGHGVLIPTNTNFATAVATANAGAEVILYDGGLYATASEIAKHLDARIKVVMVVHIGGYVSDELDAIAHLCEQRNVALVEDAAHAHGAIYGARRAGTFGVAAAFSLVHTKVLTTGEGGLVTTNDDDIARLARSYRNQGYAPDGRTHVLWGNSWRMTEVGAAIGLAQLPPLDEDCRRRSAVIRRYQAGLINTPLLTFPMLAEHCRPSGYKCIAYAESRVHRGLLSDRLRNEGIQLARGVYELPLHKHPIMAEHTRSDRRFPAADKFADQHICLPLWKSIPEDVVEWIIGRIHQVAVSLV